MTVEFLEERFIDGTGSHATQYALLDPLRAVLPCPFGDLLKDRVNAIVGLSADEDVLAHEDHCNADGAESVRYAGARAAFEHESGGSASGKRKQVCLLLLQI